jgi:NhaP-type Na+/H+ or K+/H+ antiporter
MLPAAHFLIAGAVVLAAVWLPLFLGRVPLSLPIVAVAAGWIGFGVFGQAGFFANNAAVMSSLAEIVLVTAVMGAGLRVDRSFSLAGWMSTWRLISLVMPLSILAMAALAVWMLGLPLPLALLIGAILAPTDPVLASSVGLGPPEEKKQGSAVSFALTSEAGLNDGLALPFVVLAITLMRDSDDLGALLAHWATVEVLWEIMAGAAIGFGLGWSLVRVSHALPERLRLSASGQGIAVVGVMSLVYGAAQLSGANGLVAVFVAGATIRLTASDLDYTRQNHAFAEQIERLAMTVVLILFGGVLAGGAVKIVDGAHIAFAVLTLFVVRPIAVAIGFLGSAMPTRERAALGLLGIRGIGSLFYTFYAVSTGVPNYAVLWGEVSLTVLLSIVIYGVGTDWMMRRLHI